MPLKLRVARGDKIHVGDNCVITVKTHTDHKVMVEVDADQSLEVFTKFADESQQHKNAQKASRLTPEEQQRRKLQTIRRKS